MTLRFSAFPQGARHAFGIDLDAAAATRRTTIVGGPDLAGARLVVTFAHDSGARETHDGLFGPDGQARAAAPCLS